MSANKEKRFQRIVNALLLNASFIENLGLMHGKMGIAIYFFHLARETKNQIYEDYAGELIDEIYDEICATTPLDFENGLAGIGWGIEYLVQNGFLEADTDEVLEEFDKRLIHELTYHTPEDIGLLKGFSGYITYFHCRVKESTDKNGQSIANREALLKAIDLLAKWVTERHTAGNLEELWSEPVTFDITWNYTAILWALTGLLEAGIFGAASERIINMILTPLKTKTVFPRLQNNRLLLALVIEKLKLYKPEKFPTNTFDELIQKLLSGLDRETIFSELTPDYAFLQNGTGGIAWIYRQLFLLTNNDHFRDESLYWDSHGFGFTETDQGYAGFYIDKENENKASGLLEGLTGIGLMSLPYSNLNI
jgi:hypothetical protein